MSLKQFILVLLARWKIGAAIFIAVVAMGIVYTMFSTKLYTASATVVIDQKSDPVAGVVYQSQLQSGYIATQVDIIRSGRFAQRGVNPVNLNHPRGFVEGGRGAPKEKPVLA